ncbi:hypothetical protein CORC01_04767 [Colletotrichum orchidophilum]|uniref:Uncharacterized protein n=1 Tax=Colletotrichum orchidophilum TaxID=1209926 RepID=A0A1G4BEV7_9PEZI|nr:uncharacterized protein CORC01_04767 [Colletotrichum orchidophilum]OHE99866.1 hypothetical protein CORC01_04767 [Colletotrichum orchidophilum]
MSSFSTKRTSSRPWTVPHRSMSLTQINNNMGANGNPLQPASLEEQLPSSSPSGTEGDIVFERTSTTLFVEQHRGLHTLHIKRESRLNEIRVKFFRRRSESRKSFEIERSIAIEDYNNAPCWALFRPSPKRKIDGINLKQQNGMRFFAEAERIERGAVERK